MQRLLVHQNQINKIQQQFLDEANYLWNYLGLIHRFLKSSWCMNFRTAYCYDKIKFKRPDFFPSRKSSLIHVLGDSISYDFINLQLPKGQAVQRKTNFSCCWQKVGFIHNFLGKKSTEFEFQVHLILFMSLLRFF